MAVTVGLEQRIAERLRVHTAPVGVLPTPALAHDYLLVLRGAERTFAAMADIWPRAPIYTLLYDEESTQGRFRSHPVRPSKLQSLGVRQSNFRKLLPLYPRVADRLGEGRDELVLSSSSAFAHRTPVAPGGVHVCYCHSPFRYLWHERDRAVREVPRSLGRVLDRALDGMRSSDVRAARAVTLLIANSRITQERIAQCWGREAPILHPPVEVSRFRNGGPSEPEDWFLIVGELVGHKRTDLALRAAARAGRRVKVVGTGPEHARWEAQFGGRTADFLGRVSDEELVSLYRRARALIMPNAEEFGIAAVEAQAAGRPVLSITAGGALETVVDGETGVLVPPGDETALAEAMREVDFEAFDGERISRHAQRFSVPAFQDGLVRQVANAWAKR